MILATTTTRRGFVDSSPLDGWVTGGRGDATSLMVGREDFTFPSGARIFKIFLLEEDSFSSTYADSDFIF